MDTSIESLTLDVTDPAASQAFYETGLGVASQVHARTAETPSTGFRGFSISLLAAQPSNVDLLEEAALAAGAESVKHAKKGMWGYGAVIRDADGVIWQLATSTKKDKGEATRQVDDLVVLIGVEDLGASKRFYVEHGLNVKRSFPGRYVEFAAPEGSIKLALYPGRAGVAKVVGVSPEGEGPHGIALNSGAGQFSDPDGFAWEPASTTR